MSFLSKTLVVRFDDQSKSVLIEHPDRKEFPSPLVQIRYETYSEMSFDEACAFIGSRIVLLIPDLREQYQKDIDRLANL